jgi:hypothetical protein
MRFHARRTFRLGPLFFSFTERGFSSWGVRLGRYAYNVTHRTSSFDTPGVGGLRHRHGARRR